MRRHLGSFSLALLLGIALISDSNAQSPSVLYTWDNLGNASPNIESWVRNFGAASTSATLSNATLGSLSITETSATLGGSQAFSDGGNRVRESLTSGSGGTDLTGLDWLEFDLGHSGVGNINVQFFVQASTGFNYVGLGPDLAVAPGINTYQVPITGLTANQAVYVRTIGFNVRDHAAEGNLTWTLNEVRSGGTPLTFRDLITHNTGTPEGGLQGAIGNFDLTAIQGNDGGQNQSGLSHNPAGSGSLQWTDLGGSNGAAISWGNGTAWNGNSFNMRETDLSNYQYMTVRISALDPLGAGGTLPVAAFFQRNNFSFQGVATTANLPIDGQFYDLVFPLAGLTLMQGVDLTGINLGSHANNLIMNVDGIRFTIPEPGTITLLGMALLSVLSLQRKR